MKYQAFIPVLAAVIITVLLANWRGDKLETAMRNTLYSLANDSVPEYSREFTDSNGIPYVDYRELNGITAGKQYNPTIVCNYALDYFAEKRSELLDRRFKACADWLRAAYENKNGYGLFLFNWQQPWYDSVGVPYTSGMTSGLAIEVFSKAFQRYHDSSYLFAASQLLRGFYVPVQSGGFTHLANDGWWYEELADTAMHTPFILDGHIFAITGVYAYWRLTRDDSAKQVIAEGLQALKSRLPAYDAGNGWSYYDRYGKRSDNKYHRLLTAQLKSVYEISGDPYFLRYHQAWRKSLDKPYLLRAFGEGNRSGMLMVLVLLVASYLVSLFAYRFARR